MSEGKVGSKTTWTIPLPFLCTPVEKGRIPFTSRCWQQPKCFLEVLRPGEVERSVEERGWHGPVCPLLAPGPAACTLNASVSLCVNMKSLHPTTAGANEVVVLGCKPLSLCSNSCSYFISAGIMSIFLSWGSSKTRVGASHLQKIGYRWFSVLELAVISVWNESDACACCRCRCTLFSGGEHHALCVQWAQCGSALGLFCGFRAAISASLQLCQGRLRAL